MLKVLFTVSTLILSSYGGCYDFPTEHEDPEPLKGYLYGFVKDASSGSFIDTVTVCLQKGAVKRYYHLKTPRQYTFDYTADGDYDLFATSVGYVTDTVVLHLRVDTAIRRDIYMTPVTGG